MKHPKKRQESIDLLDSYLKNPGRFIITVFGSRGTGKTHWLDELIKAKINKLKKDKPQCLVLKAHMCKATIEFWEDVLRRTSNGYLVLDEIEQFKEHQDLLFEAFSTTDGNFGLVEKKYPVRVICTSSMDVSRFRNHAPILELKFYDRISQLVVKFPDLKQTQSNVWNDFEATWKKMEFPLKSRPNESFRRWLESNVDRLHGNFRDLDKLAINYFHFIQNSQSAEKAQEITLKQFDEYNSFPESAKKIEEGIYFQTGIKYDDYLMSLRKKLKEWALDNAEGDMLVAAEALGVSHRTMERWR
jgi:DNA-binding NtrC family response regulator